MQIGDLDDAERSVTRRHARSLGGR
jgi:hypothetical protein